MKSELEGYRAIGAKEGYSEAQIEAYGDFIRLCLKQFELAAKRDGGSSDCAKCNVPLRAEWKELEGDE